MSSERIQHERELFERHLKQRAPGVNLQRLGAEYIDRDVQLHFDTWLARADMALQEVDLSSDERVAALCDLSYKAGLKAGWNYCADDDQTGFARSIESTREAVAVLNEHRQKGAITRAAAEIGKEMES